MGIVPQKKQLEKFNDFIGISYFFCGAERHKKNQCTNYHVWCAKKGMLILVCFEVNLTSVPRHTWWLDFSATLMSVFMQDCLSCRKPNDVARYIHANDGKMVQVEKI